MNSIAWANSLLKPTDSDTYVLRAFTITFIPNDSDNSLSSEYGRHRLPDL